MCKVVVEVKEIEEAREHQPSPAMWCFTEAQPQPKVEEREGEPQSREKPSFYSQHKLKFSNSIHLYGGGGL